MDRPADDELHFIPGNPPNLMDLGSGCHFRERCSKVMDVCSEDPPLQVAQDGRMSRCFIDMTNGAEATVAGVAGTEDAATETAE
jgi:ABC-type dipeptide/oligopeptide/nickel transport system ATPase component